MAPNLKEPGTSKTELLRPTDFGAVVEGKIYRSAYPLPKYYPFFESLKLRSVICLHPKPYWKNNLEFLEATNIQLIHIGISDGESVDTMEIPEDAITEALKEVVDERNHPVLIHCLGGKHQTGCLAGCFRKLQNWCLPAILEEYKQFAGEQTRDIDLAFLKEYEVSRLKRLPSSLVGPDCPCCADKSTNTPTKRRESRLDMVEKDIHELWAELDKVHSQLAKLDRLDRIEGLLEALLGKKGPNMSAGSLGPGRPAKANVRLSLDDVLEPKANDGLCFKCRGPYHPRHKCPRKSLQVDPPGRSFWRPISRDVKSSAVSNGGVVRD
ncbi:probable tyrosine-protein phosphatase at1g05000 [Phtheirospermum japonicum]|uniref:Probable tyrosine-protein phosphatase at1g05000 n=1 Tax=Phtheirospermum japonicum TaxID=374723 RepID=A0A830AZF8_9LAMI|nr:probable tyrosine-protein phosphatase at1g05000 [Phtheirospermum japonicum]